MGIMAEERGGKVFATDERLAVFPFFEILPAYNNDIDSALIMVS